MPSTLLLADDSVTIQRVIELTFASEDIRVVATSDGEAAIRQINAEPPDVVLADVGMPKVDGYAVAAHIKHTPLLRHIPVLLLTGAFDPIDEEKAKASGCDGILVKPFEPQQLVSRVKELLAGGWAPVFRPVPDRPIVRESPAPRAPSTWDAVLPPPTTHAPAPPPAPAPLSRATEPREPEAAETSDIEQHVRRQIDEFDAAFAALDAEPAATSLDDETISGLARDLDLYLSEPNRTARPFGEWDLPSPPPQADVTTRPAEPPMPPPEAPRRAAADPPVFGETIFAGAMSKSSMAAAFSALLAAEQAQPRSVRAPRPPTMMSDAAIEEIVQRVLHRMTDDVVRRVVLETAERLIKEEIAKIRTAAGNPS